MYLKSQLNFCFNFNFSGICFIFNFNFNFSGMVAVCAGCDSYYPWNALIVSSGSGFVYLVKKNLKHVFCFALCVVNICLPRGWLTPGFIYLVNFCLKNVFFLSFMFCKYLPSKRFKRGIVNLVTIFEKKPCKSAIINLGYARSLLQMR